MILALAGAVAAGVGLFVWFGRGAEPDPPRPTNDLSQKVGKCVFFLQSTFIHEGDAQKEDVFYGSCVAVAPAGTFVTAAHNLAPRDRLKSVSLTIHGKWVEARPVAADDRCDSAVLAVRKYEGDVLPLAADAPPASAAVFIFGYPTRYSGVVAPDVISTGGWSEGMCPPPADLPGVESSLLRIRGATNHGGSGGAVVDKSGNLVGLVVAAQFVDNRPVRVYAAPSSRLSELLKDRGAKP